MTPDPVSADRQWFASHRSRTHRIRRPIGKECEASQDDLVIVRQIYPGARRRLGVRLVGVTSPRDLARVMALPDDAASALYDLVLGHAGYVIPLESVESIARLRDMVGGNA